MVETTHSIEEEPIQLCILFRTRKGAWDGQAPPPPPPLPEKKIATWVAASCTKRASSPYCDTALRFAVPWKELALGNDCKDSA